MEFISKRRLFGAFCMLGMAVSSALFFVGCSDFGIEADLFKGKVKGKLFFTEAAPENTDEIRVVVSQKFPPIDFKTHLFSGPLPFNRDAADTIDYEVDVPLGTYDYVFVLWKGKDQPLSLAGIIGQFGDILGTPVTVTEDDSVVTDININVDFERVLRGGFISGRIRLIGEVPDNTAGMAFIASEFIPETNQDLFTPPFPTFEIISGPEVEFLEFDYQFAIKPAVYKYVAVVWLAQGAGLTDFKTLGIYEDPENPGQPGEVVIEEGLPGATGIDITGDFANTNN
jgi:hypothetical protein